MSSDALSGCDPLLFGGNADEGLVAVEAGADGNTGAEMVLFFREENAVRQEREPFEPFILADRQALSGCPVEHRVTPLRGGHRVNAKASFLTWKHFLAARKWLASSTGSSALSLNAPYYALNYPVQQHLVSTGRTLFMGMKFEDVRRMQVDIECFTSDGYEFCNAEREGDRIIVIAVGLPDGGEVLISGVDVGEKEMIEKFVELVVKHDPDVIEGHNIFNFDLPYIAARARRHKVPLTLGRNGTAPSRRSSRLSMGDRMI